jgi:fibronectin type 3 domain-containing protein
MPPAVIGNFSVTGLPIPACVISWNSVSGVTGYHLYRSTNGNDYAQIGADITGQWNTSYTDTDVSAGSTYYYKLAAYNDNGEGELQSWGEPGTPLDSSVLTELSPNDWTNDEISEQWETKWYSFTASEGSNYKVQWNTAYYGDGTQTLPYTYVSAFASNGNPIFPENSQGWANPPTVSSVSGTVYLRVEGYNDLGTYAIRYYEPAVLPPQAAITISSVSTTLVPDPSCYISWNSVEGVTGYHLFRSTDYDSGYAQIGGDLTYTFYTDDSVSVDSTYYYKVAAYNDNGDGELSSARSGVLVVTALSNDSWTEGEIVASGDVHWYSFDVAEGSTYLVEWNYNDGSYTLPSANVSATLADGSWLSLPTVSGVTGTVYLKVEAYGQTGTYAIKYAED